jgi:hypothetical protein
MIFPPARRLPRKGLPTRSTPYGESETQGPRVVPVPVVPAALATPRRDGRTAWKHSAGRRARTVADSAATLSEPVLRRLHGHNDRFRIAHAIDVALPRAYAPAMATPRARRYICGLCGRSIAAVGYQAEDLPLKERLCSECQTLPPPPRNRGEEDQDEGDSEAGASAGDPTVALSHPSAGRR